MAEPTIVIGDVYKNPDPSTAPQKARLRSGGQDIEDVNKAR